MFKILIIEFVSLFLSRLIIQSAFQNFNYYVSLAISSGAENENDEKKILTELIMHEI